MHNIPGLPNRIFLITFRKIPFSKYWESIQKRRWNNMHTRMEYSITVLYLAVRW